MGVLAISQGVFGEWQLDLLLYLHYFVRVATIPNEILENLK